jgi:hypothetical protein
MLTPNTFTVLRLLPVSDRDKDTEILALRHQIVVLERRLGGKKVWFTPPDRAFLAALLHRLAPPEGTRVGAENSATGRDLGLLFARRRLSEASRIEIEMYAGPYMPGSPPGWAQNASRTLALSWSAAMSAASRSTNRVGAGLGVPSERRPGPWCRRADRVWSCGRRGSG